MSRAVKSNLLKWHEASGAGRILVITVILTAIGGSGICYADEQGISWSFTPYIWGANTKLDLKWRDSPVGNGADISFGDLVDTLESAAMFQLEAGRNNWSSFVDLTYLSTSDSAGQGQLELSADSKQYFVDLAASYWPVSMGFGLNVYGGIRYTRFENDYSLAVAGAPLADTGSTQSYADALIGIRYLAQIDEHWGYLLRADTSFGDSEGTWLVRAMGTYDVGKAGGSSVLFGYQFKSAEFREQDFTSKYSYQGFVAGFQFRF